MSKKLGRPPKLSILTAKAIEQRYLSNTKIGMRLPPEQKMAKELNVSRGTIRTALRYLEEQRRVSKLRAKSSLVSGWTQQRVHMNLFEILIGDYRPGYHYRLADAHWQCVLAGIYNAFYGLRADLTLSFHDVEMMNRLGELRESHFVRDVVKGVLFLGEQHSSVYTAISRIRKPTVVVDEDASAYGLDSICFADEEAGRYLAQRLMLLGHRRFLMVRESPRRPVQQQDQAWQRRSFGVFEELKACGHCPEIIDLESRSNSADNAAPRVLHFLRKLSPERPTALIVPTLAAPREWITLARNAELEPSRDISIAGFGGAHEDPTMTGIRFDSTQLGHVAGNILRQWVLDPEKPQKAGKVSLVKGVYVAGETHGRASIE